MELRHIKLEDAEAFVQLIKDVENDAQYMLFEQEERNLSVEEQRERINKMQQDQQSTIIVAEESGELIGYLIAYGGQAKRNSHSAYLIVGIKKDQRGKGVGTKLFQTLEEWALKNGKHRLELTVVTRNEAGLALYKKAGFEVEGVKRHSLLIDNEFVDEYYMSKLY
ncbi:GNAT family N-acetyltransferase [Bacillus sp. NTK071]|uniref:GNAT family N-acetyltransferase n=1 Tax=Bacillus sp. NTK071 TaxID=2802175 RepID=UPI001A8E716C|nr:GNAT family N-acetyltransferase [Bacillus sp. NTK071]